MKLLKLVWDTIGTEFGGRNELYELNYAGNHENIRLEALKLADIHGDTAKYKAFVDQALSEYDLSGWTTNEWVNTNKVGEMV